MCGINNEHRAPLQVIHRSVQVSVCFTLSPHSEDKGFRAFNQCLDAVL